MFYSQKKQKVRIALVKFSKDLLYVRLSGEKYIFEIFIINLPLFFFQAVVSAPIVQPNETMDDRRHLDPMTKELAYNPKFDELFAPVAGPVNPNKTQQESAVKNTLAGYVEPAHVNHFQFELEPTNTQKARSPKL